MLDPSGLVAISLAFLIVTASPGPANIALATVAMSSGRPSGLLFGAGLSLGLAIWGVVAATGLGALLQTSASALTLLKLVGGLYLLWLAFASGRAAVRPTARPVAAPAPGAWFWRGLMLNLSNPKAVVAWMAALSMGLGGGDGLAQLLLATLVCMAIGVVNYTGYALAFSLRGAMRLYQRLRRWIDGIVAGLFAVAGLALIRSAVSR
ncbi:MAG: LysE family translocator [Silicimonas sp.]|nr:LysE family translocator [Silicimonas sp.]RZW12446.1 MAG: LysE family translocator [Paracoccaceae bacterium]